MSELYELPRGWEWKRLGDAVQIGCTKGFKVKPINGKVPFIKMSNIDAKKGRDTQYALEEYAKVAHGKTKFEKNAVLVGKITPCTQNNKTTIVPSVLDGGFATTEVYALHARSNSSPYYLNYFMRSERINTYLVSTMTGATGRQRVPSSSLKQLKIPLPPLKEQKRIVAKLDKLFEKIDQAITLLQQNIETVNAFMPSVLDDVFGELEKKYQSVQLEALATFQNGFAFKSTEFNTARQGLKVTRIGNVLNVNKNLIYIDERKEFRKYLLKKGDIIISMTGTRKKKDYLFARMIDKEDSYLNQRVGRISNKDNSKYQYLYYFLQSNYFRNPIFDYETGTVNQGNISGKDIMNSQIPYPPLPTQQKVVHYLDQLTSKIEPIKQAQQDKLASLKALKASILDKAFRGEL